MKKIKLIALFIVFSLTVSPAYATLQTATVWEFRTTGSNDNGGGYVTGASGTDYSQQDSAQLTLTDLATDGAGTALSSATGGFTAAMIGNIIYIKSGTGFTVSWYEITAYTDTNNVTIDRSAGASASAGTGSVGGARSLPTDAFFELIGTQTDGNYIWFEAGTYTLTESINVVADGSAPDPFVLGGYNTTRGDDPTGTDRPLIAAGANLWSFDNYWHHRNYRLTTTAAAGLKSDTNAVIVNVYSLQSGASSAEAITTNLQSLVINSEIEGGNGLVTNSVNVYNTYIHDTAGDCMRVGGGVLSTIVGNVFDTCTNEGLDIDIRDTMFVSNNVFYNCGVGMDIEADAYGNIITNNIFDANTVGMNADTENGERETTIIDYNVWDNTTDIQGGKSKGPNAVTGDPGLTDPANGDFTLGSGSNAIDAGLKLSTDVGTTGTYKNNAGVDQDDVSAGGGGGGASAYTFVN